MKLPRLHSWSRSGGVAIDIGSSSVKLLELAAVPGGWRLRRAGIAPLSHGAVINHMVEDTAAVARALKTLMKTCTVRENKAIVSIPGKCVMLKRLRIRPQPGEALHDTVAFEAVDAIPESIENVHLDFAVLEEADDGGEIGVLLVAARKDLLQRHTDALCAAGLVPSIVDVDYFALQRMHLHSQPRDTPAIGKNTVGLVHIGARSTTIHILQGESSLFTNDLPMGGEDFTERLMVELGIDHAAAERWKVQGAEPGERVSGIEPVLMPLAQQLAREIHRTVNLWEAVATETRLDRIFLSGGTSMLPCLYDSCLETLRVPVLRSQPLSSFALGSDLQADQWRRLEPGFAVAAGLAFRVADASHD